MNARELIHAFVSALLTKDVDALADLYHPDGEHCWAFRPGRPVIRGREAVRDHLRTGLGRSPIRFHRVTDRTVHDTTDPATVVAELTFEVSTGGEPFPLSYVEVLTERDGLIGSLRDYENLAGRGGA